MIALVDDWGNPNPTKLATKWFGFASILLRDNQIDEIRDFNDAVCDCLDYPQDTPLHLKNFGLNNKYHITNLLAQKNPTVSIIAVHLPNITSERLKRKGWVYRFYSKEIIRSATHFASDCGEMAKVVFHKHKYLEELELYIHNWLPANTWYMKKSPSRRIKYDNLESIHVLDDEEELLLGLADCVAHSCHLALNPDIRWHQVNPSLLNLLTHCIWKGPSYDRNPRLFGAQLDPGGIRTDLIPSLPFAIRQYWE